MIESDKKKKDSSPWIRALAKVSVLVPEIQNFSTS